MKINVSNQKVAYWYLLTVFTLTFYAVWFWPIPMLHYIGLIVGLVLPIILTPSFFSQKWFAYFVIYFFVIYLNFVSGDAYFNKSKRIIEEFVALYIPAAMLFYYNKTLDFRWSRTVLFVAIIVLVWTTISTAIIDSQSPGIVRYAHSMMQQGLEDVSAFSGFYRMGMSNYILPHAVPVLIPAFAIVLRDKDLKFKQKLLPIGILASLMMLLYFGGATGPMLIGIAVLIVSFFIKPGSTKGFWGALILVSVIVLPLLLNDELMLSLLEWLDDLMGNEGFFHYKVITFQDTIVYGSATGDVEQRQGLYAKGIAGFFENILIGSNGDIGGHSVILNRLGSLGLIGFIPYVAVLVVLSKKAIKMLPANYRVYFYLGSFAAFMMLLSKGIASWELYFFWFVVLPFAIIYFSNSTKKRIFDGKYNCVQGGI